MLFCHPCGDRQTYGSRLAPHRRRETCHLSVSVVRLFGRPSLKVARHFPQSPSNPKVNRGSGHRNESFSLPTQVCTTDHVETLGKALFQVSDIAPLTFPPFSVYLMLRAREMIRKKPRHTGPPAAGFDIPAQEKGQSSPGCRSSNPAELILPVYPAPDSALTKIATSCGVLSRSAGRERAM
jgi:hypothetical protein